MADRQNLGSSGRTQGSRSATRQPEKWTETRNGKIAIAVICVVALSTALYEFRDFFHGATPGDPNTVTFVDSQTGQPFPHKLVAGETIPVVAPSGGNTGYPAVPCFWTASGEIKKDPTWVIMNKLLGKPGPTFCPDCGRLVNPLTPPPQPGDKPPPTQEEWMRSHPQRNAGAQ